MNSEQLHDWLDRHHVHVLRMECVLPDGVQVGRFIHRDKFARSLPLGCAVSDAVLATDAAGTLNRERPLDDDDDPLSNLLQKPDLTTLITDGTDPDLGHCIVELVDRAGAEIALCPRTLLRRALERLAGLGYSAEVGVQLQFNLFEETFREARQKGYRNLQPLAVSESRLNYLNRNAYPVQKFMNDLTGRLEWRGIQWESWHVDSAPGKIALDLAPCDALTAADRAMRTRHALFEVALHRELSVTFMPQPIAGSECYLQLTPVLQPIGATKPNGGVVRADADVARDWRAGLQATRAAATALYYPSINAYRALARTPLALHAQPHGTHLGPVLGGGDANPYLALTTLLGSGAAGIRRHLAAASGGDADPRTAPRPASLGEAIEALGRDEMLGEALGREFTRYWTRSRRWEEHLFKSHALPGAAEEVTDWELHRYFELL